MHKGFSGKRTWKDARSIAFCIPLIIILTMSGPALANPGDLSNGFGNNGVFHHLMGTGSNLNGWARSVAIQGNGKIVTAGEAWAGNKRRFALARYTINGDLDPSFGGDGKVQTKFGSKSSATSVAIQGNRKIVAAGWKLQNNGTYRFALARYETNGNLDFSFSGNGKLVTPIGAESFAHAVAIQPLDQKIVVAGSATVANNDGFALARYLPNGAPDNGFDSDGEVHTPLGLRSGATSVAIQSNGQIVAAGNANTTTTNSVFALARYNSSGALDNGFSGGGGTVTIPFGPPSTSNAGADSLAIDGSGMIVAAGFSGHGTNSRFALVRYDPLLGTLDTNFDVDGKVTTNIAAYSGAHSVAIQGNGKIVAAGFGVQAGKGRFAVARYEPVAGALDSSFGNGGKVKTLIGTDGFADSVVIQPSNGKIVVAGGTVVGNKFRFAVARYDD